MQQNNHDAHIDQIIAHFPGMSGPEFQTAFDLFKPYASIATNPHVSLCVETLLDFLLAPNATLEAKKTMLALHFGGLHPSNSTAIAWFVVYANPIPPQSFNSAYGFGDGFSPNPIHLSDKALDRINTAYANFVLRHTADVFTQPSWREATTRSKVIVDSICDAPNMDITEKTVILDFASHSILERMIAYHVPKLLLQQCNHILSPFRESSKKAT